MRSATFPTGPGTPRIPDELGGRVQLRLLGCRPVVDWVAASELQAAIFRESVLQASTMTIAARPWWFSMILAAPVPRKVWWMAW
jgi:hypothetical protein